MGELTKNRVLESPNGSLVLGRGKKTWTSHAEQSRKKERDNGHDIIIACFLLLQGVFVCLACNCELKSLSNLRAHCKGGVHFRAALNIKFQQEQSNSM